MAKEKRMSKRESVKKYEKEVGASTVIDKNEKKQFKTKKDEHAIKTKTVNWNKRKDLPLPKKSLFQHILSGLTKLWEALTAPIKNLFEKKPEVIIGPNHDHPQKIDEIHANEVVNIVVPEYELENSSPSQENDKNNNSNNDKENQRTIFGAPLMPNNEDVDKLYEEQIKNAKDIFEVCEIMKNDKRIRDDFSEKVLCEELSMNFSNRFGNVKIEALPTKLEGGYYEFQLTEEATGNKYTIAPDGKVLGTDKDGNQLDSTSIAPFVAEMSHFIEKNKQFIDKIVFISSIEKSGLNQAYDKLSPLAREQIDMLNPSEFQVYNNTVASITRYNGLSSDKDVIDYMERFANDISDINRKYIVFTLATQHLLDGKNADEIKQIYDFMSSLEILNDNLKNIAVNDLQAKMLLNNENKDIQEIISEIEEFMKKEIAEQKEMETFVPDIDIVELPENLDLTDSEPNISTDNEDKENNKEKNEDDLDI